MKATTKSLLRVGNSIFFKPRVSELGRVSEKRSDAMDAAKD